MTIHPTAIIHPTSKIAASAAIDAYAVIGPEVILGDRCHIHPHAVLEYARLGPDCEVYPHACLGLPPQHIQYKGEKTSLTVGAGSIFREGVIVHRGSPFGVGVTTVGEKGFFMAQSHIAHDCVVGDRVILANAAMLAGHVSVGNDVFISATAAVHQYTRVGEGALVSGGAMVSLDVAPFCLAQGDRARIRGINLVGLKRHGASREEIKKLKEAYRVLFFSGLSLEDALNHPALLREGPLVTTFRTFLVGSKRGFLRPARAAKEEKLEEQAAL